MYEIPSKREKKFRLDRCQYKQKVLYFSFSNFLGCILNNKLTIRNLNARMYAASLCGQQNVMNEFFNIKNHIKRFILEKSKKKTKMNELRMQYKRHCLNNY